MHETGLSPQGAAGAAEIMAVDVKAAKLRTAEQLGATAVVDARRRDPVSAVMDLTGRRGADVAFEVIGLQRTIDQVITMTRRYGQAVSSGYRRWTWWSTCRPFSV